MKYIIIFLICALFGIVCCGISLWCAGGFNSYSITEKGINVLYMTFGLITYKEKRETYKAPLLLIPINIDLDNKIDEVLPAE